MMFSTMLSSLMSLCVSCELTVDMLYTLSPWRNASDGLNASLLNIYKLREFLRYLGYV